jgi:hypothetical protein
LKGPTPSLFHLCARATNPSVSVFSVCFPVKSVASVQKCFGFRFLQSGSAVPRDQRLPTGFSFLLILIWAPALRWRRSRFPESLHSLIYFSRSIFPARFSAPVRDLVRWSAFFSVGPCPRPRSAFHARKAKLPSLTPVDFFGAAEEFSVSARGRISANVQFPPAHTCARC